MRMSVVNIRDDTEIWNDIPGYNGDYQASSFERIRNINFKNQWGKFKRKSPRIMKPNKSHTYDMVIINGKNKTVHRLVASAFLGEHKELVVNHIDGNKRNNAICNLEFCTIRQNSIHAYRVLGVTPKTKNMHGKDFSSSKPIIAFSKDGKDIKRYEGIRDAERFGGFCHASIIRVIKSGKQYKGYYFKYEN